jgi:hypothetical protein
MFRLIYKTIFRLQLKRFFWFTIDKIELIIFFKFYIIKFVLDYLYIQGADKSIARPTSRCILFDGENILFDVSLVI